MPKFIVKSPDGVKYEVNAPEGATQEDAIEYIKNKLAKEQVEETATTVEEQPKEEKETSWLESIFGETGKQTAELLGSQGKSALDKFQTGVARGVFDPIVGAAQLGLTVAGQEEAGRDVARKYKESMGESSTVGEIVGGVASPLNKLFGGISTGSRLATFGSSIKMGALQSVLQPSDTESFWRDKAFNAGVGAALGGAFPLAGFGVVKLREIFGNVNLSEKARLKELREYLVKLTGDKRDEVVADLRNAGINVTGSKPTVGEALADSSAGANLAAAQAKLERKPTVSSMFSERAREQQVARQEALGEISSPQGAGVEDVMAAREAATQDLRQTALEQANVYGRVAPQLEADIAQREAAAIGALQGQGRTATEAAQATVRFQRGAPGWLSNASRAVEYKEAAKQFGDVVEQRKAEAAFKQLQLNSLKDEGFYPLEVNSIVDDLAKKAAAPGIAVKTPIVNVFNEVKDDLQKFSSANGVIDSENLYAIRQTIGEKLQASYAKLNMTGSQKMLMNIERNIQKSIDSAIEKASGGNLWQQYLNNYSEYSKKIERMQLGRALQQKLRGDLDIEKAASFARAVNNSKPLVSEVTGRKTTMNKVLDEREMNIVGAVLADVTRMEKAKKAASKVTLDAVKEPTPQVTIFSQAVTTAKDIMRYLREGNQTFVDRKMAELMLDTDKMADFIEVLPKSSFDKLIPIMIKNMKPEVANEFIGRFGVSTAATVVD